MIIPFQKNLHANCANTLCGVLCCLFICATIVIVTYLHTSSNSAPQRRLWVPVVVETNGNQAILGETRQMEFWTPSAKTKDYLPKENGLVFDKEKWQVISNDDAVVQFGLLLHSNLGVLGYRRVEIWGQGRTTFKPGWWWTMNVSTNYTIGELTHA